MSFSLIGLISADCFPSPPNRSEDIIEEAAVFPATFISLKVFHSPQLGHLPIHFVDSCPQLLHT